MLFYNLRAEIDRLHSEIIATVNKLPAFCQSVSLSSPDPNTRAVTALVAEFTAIRNQVNSAFERIHVNVACVERSVYESQCKEESR